MVIHRIFVASLSFALILGAAAGCRSHDSGGGKLTPEKAGGSSGKNERDPHVWYQREQTEEAAILDLLKTQAAAWNAGDIDGFMKGYWNSERLTFSSGGATQRGWQATYDRYKTRYPTPERMGRLEFGQFEVQLLGERPRTAALVLGRWYLHRSPDPVGGNFSLVLWKHPSDGWLIIHDHTSTDSQARPPARDR